MKKEFWLEKWTSGLTPWNQQEVNEALRKWWPKIQIEQEREVFVPCCGKSIDLLYFTQMKLSVFGVDLAEQPLVEFRDEQRQNKYLNLRCEDFFKLTVTDRPFFPGRPIFVYDRASLIAFPPEMRRKYYDQMISLYPPSSTILLLTIEYDGFIEAGPPFSVPESEIRSSLESHFAIEKWEEEISANTNQRQFALGLKETKKVVYKLERK